MATTLSIYCNNELTEQVKQRTRQGDSLSAVGKVLFERGIAVLQAETRALANLFTEPEWQVILDSFNGVLTDPEFIPHITVNVEDNINLNDAGARYGLTAQQGRDLIARIDDLSAGAKWAILDTAERFWNSGLEPNADGLKKLGVVCYGETD